MSLSRKGLSTLWVYCSIVVIFLSIVVATATISPAAATHHTITDDHPRSLSTGWVDNPPKSLSHKWTISGVTNMVHAPGVTVAATNNEVFRVNPDDGSRLWEYSRKDATVCDVQQAWGDVVVIYNPGHGCTDITRLDSETGEYVSQASYATDQDQARMVFGNESDLLAVATPHMVRVLRDDLVTTAEFGQKVDPENPSSVNRCNIFDVSVGPESFAVAHDCTSTGTGTTHVTVLESKPEDSTEPGTVVDVDTRTTDSVTIPVVTLAQVQFVTQGVNPTAFTWQIDKDKEEVGSRPVNEWEYGLGGASFDGIGYVWLVGTTLQQRYGSEDVSQHTHKTVGASGLPMEIDGRLLFPTFTGVSLWNPDNGHVTPINFDTPVNTKKISVSGSTVAVLSEGSLIGFSAS